MTRVELKQWAKDKVKGKRWSLLPAIIVAGIITGLAIPYGRNPDTGMTTSISIGWIFFFVEIGLTYFMVQFINDKEYKFNDIFKFSNIFVKSLIVSILRAVFVFLWALLLIIPGIMKAFSYSLIPMIMADDKYKDLEGTAVLKKSQEMMQGHRMDFFVLMLSFIGWHILAVFTLFILELWIIPYQEAAQIKFLYDVKSDYEAKNKTA